MSSHSRWTLLGCLAALTVADGKNCFQFNTTLGQWSYEISWEVYDAHEEAVASLTLPPGIDGSTHTQFVGVVVSTDVCLVDGCYTLVVADSYGDGWNGATLVSDGLDATLKTGSYEIYSFNVVDGTLDWPSTCPSTPIKTFVTNEGVERTYFYYAPSNLPFNAPLMFVMHGMGGTALDYWRNDFIKQKARDEKFALVYPQGLVDFRGFTHWNAGFLLSDVDDVGFVVQLSEYLQRTQGLSSAILWGHSNGHFMSYELACRRPADFVLAGGFAGKMSNTTYYSCDFPDVPIFHIHGTADNIVPTTIRRLVCSTQVSKMAKFCSNPFSTLSPDGRSTTMQRRL